MWNKSKYGSRTDESSTDDQTNKNIHLIPIKSSLFRFEPVFRLYFNFVQLQTGSIQFFCKYVCTAKTDKSFFIATDKYNININFNEAFLQWSKAYAVYHMLEYTNRSLEVTPLQRVDASIFLQAESLNL